MREHVPFWPFPTLSKVLETGVLRFSFTFVAIQECDELKLGVWFVALRIELANDFIGRENRSSEHFCEGKI